MNNPCCKKARKKKGPSGVKARAGQEGKMGGRKEIRPGGSGVGKNRMCWF